MPSALTIVPDISRKTAVLAGAVSAGELVDVTVSGLGAVTGDPSPSLRLRVCIGRRLLAEFPARDPGTGLPAEGEEWSKTGPGGRDLSCRLNLATDGMARLFRRIGEADLVFALDDAGAGERRLYFAARHTVYRWNEVYGPGGAPEDLSGYADRIGLAEDAIGRLEARLDAPGAAIGGGAFPHGDGTLSTGAAGLGDLYFQETALEDLLDAWIEGKSPAWADITGRPDGFPPAAHTHSPDDVENPPWLTEEAEFRNWRNGNCVAAGQGASIAAVSSENASSNVAVGRAASASGIGGNVAVGPQSSAAGFGSVAIGAEAGVADLYDPSRGNTGQGGVAIGAGAKVLDGDLRAVVVGVCYNAAGDLHSNGPDTFTVGAPDLAHFYFKETPLSELISSSQALADLRAAVSALQERAAAAEAHAADGALHLQSGERARWDAAAGRVWQDVIVEGGRLYVPDEGAGLWRRVVAADDPDMGPTLSVSPETYERAGDGTFALTGET